MAPPRGGVTGPTMVRGSAGATIPALFKPQFLLVTTGTNYSDAADCHQAFIVAAIWGEVFGELESIEEMLCPKKLPNITRKHQHTIRTLLTIMVKRPSTTTPD